MLTNKLSEIAEQYVRLNFYVPQDHLESVKKAVFDAGAGHYPGYDRCCWQTLGTGQFRPLEGSSPFVGEKQTVEVVVEYKVEMLCPKKHLDSIIDAFLNAHPYEVPAFDVTALYHSVNEGE